MTVYTEAGIRFNLLCFLVGGIAWLEAKQPGLFQVIVGSVDQDRCSIGELERVDVLKTLPFTIDQFSQSSRPGISPGFRSNQEIARPPESLLVFRGFIGESVSRMR